MQADMVCHFQSFLTPAMQIKTVTFWVLIYWRSQKGGHSTVLLACGLFEFTYMYLKFMYMTFLSPDFIPLSDFKYN